MIYNINSGLICVSRGIGKYESSKFKSISSSHRNKPVGGLWSCPINSEYQWEHWCLSNDWNPSNPGTEFKFQFLGKIASVSNEKDMDVIPKMTSLITLERVVDFKKLSEMVDALWLTQAGLDNHNIMEDWFYGWDVVSVLILNSKSIHPL